MWLQFDGANTTALVWVNGVRLGEHKGGCSRFRFDATTVLRPGRDNGDRGEGRPYPHRPGHVDPHRLTNIDFWRSI